ncbi:hypothetical protein FB451DRAFT_1172302 [Mycena latifolia]|nr:hypothetical protein FB451DRAFT_1172302 [Mycena latifolia]
MPASAKVFPQAHQQFDKLAAPYGQHDSLSTNTQNPMTHKSSSTSPCYTATPGTLHLLPNVDLDGAARSKNGSAGNRLKDRAWGQLSSFTLPAKCPSETGNARLLFTVPDEDQMGRDCVRRVCEAPDERQGRCSCPVHLTGESYGGNRPTGRSSSPHIAWQISRGCFLENTRLYARDKQHKRLAARPPGAVLTSTGYLPPGAATSIVANG